MKLNQSAREKIIKAIEIECLNSVQAGYIADAILAILPELVGKEKES